MIGPRTSPTERIGFVVVAMASERTISCMPLSRWSDSGAVARATPTSWRQVVGDIPVIASIAPEGLNGRWSRCHSATVAATFAVGGSVH